MDESLERCEKTNKLKNDVGTQDGINLFVSRTFIWEEWSCSSWLPVTLLDTNDAA